MARKNISGAEKSEPIACGGEVAIRESRRIIGEKYITYKEYLDGKLYDDAICYVYYPIDLHTEGINSLENVFLEKGRVPTIPFGALVPRGISNLLVAGRCISGDRLANSAFRMKAFCMAMGQAAGAGAYLAIKNDAAVKNIEVSKLKEILKLAGAIVP